MRLSSAITISIPACCFSVNSASRIVTQSNPTAMA
jgi:hypothetical protein